MTNWEHYFGTPERAVLMCLEYCFEPMVLAVNRVEHINGRPVPRLVAWFNSYEGYLGWLKAEHDSHEGYAAWLKAEHDDGTVKREDE